jgi:hypothetical protein
MPDTGGERKRQFSGRCPRLIAWRLGLGKRVGIWFCEAGRGGLGLVDPSLRLGDRLVDVRLPAALRVLLLGHVPLLVHVKRWIIKAPCA